MDLLTDSVATVRPAVEKSPFWRKTYGGFTVDQVAFIKKQLEQPSGKKLYDPMSGQGSSLCQFAWEGARTYLSDLNPGPLCLAMLRDPELLRNATGLARKLRKKLLQIPMRRRPLHTSFCATWVASNVRAELCDVFSRITRTPLPSPFRAGLEFWQADPTARLAVALAVFASRALTCYRTTDNQTWLKQGGVTPTISVSEAILQALESWTSFAQLSKNCLQNNGTLALATWDATKGTIPGFGDMDAVIVSPPYANRLDYSSMWAPETSILSAIFSETSTHVKNEQMGSTVVSGRRPTETEIRSLPSIVRDALHSIRTDSAYASERYYYPFFANYAVSLCRAVSTWATLVRSKGLLLVFVRDTVRKDHLFPTEKLVTATAMSSGLLPLEAQPHLKVVRHHVGLMRQRRSGSGIHGLAQQEWWLAFERP